MSKSPLMESVDRLNAATDRLFAPREVKIVKVPQRESGQYKELNSKIEVLAQRLADAEDAIAFLRDFAS